MDDRPGRKDPPRSHWYNPAVPLDDSPSVSPRRGRTRERIRRRREEKGRPAVNWTSWTRGVIARWRRFANAWLSKRPSINWTWAVIALAILGVVGVVWVISLIMSAASGTQPGSNPTPTAARAAAIGTPTSTPPISVRAWDGKQRFTILILGLDKRPGDTGSGYNTDTIILVSIDPTTKSIGMLSIPRDLYVVIPGQSDMQRVNSAYVLGELQEPGAGPKLAMQTIQYNLGIPVNSYVIVSFDAVIGLVDAIGGINIDVPVTIDDPEYPDMNYGYDPLYIPAGPTHMDGKLALKYARTRHQDTDFDRASRQQQVLMAIRQQVLEPDVLPRLIGQAPALWDRFSKGVLTDFTLDQALSLGWYIKDIPLSNIKRGTVRDKYVLATQFNGDTVLTPNRALLGDLLTQVFGPDYNR
jgi:LCP family protein required for cell wall assembly